VLSHKSRRRDARWTGKQIAKEAGVSPATVSRVLRRYERTVSRVLRRYEREHPVNASTSTSKNSGVSMNDLLHRRCLSPRFRRDHAER
jgi:DNA-binding MurR/RpiR family transcriptional regulator